MTRWYTVCPIHAPHAYQGVKIARSAAALPLLVETEPIGCSKAFMMRFNAHLVLIYTGKTRLARNLLQNVIRQW